MHYVIYYVMHYIQLQLPPKSFPFRRKPEVLGLCLSLILLQIISTGFNLLGFSPHLTEAIWGATMILAIAIALVRDRWVARLWLRKTLK